MEWFLWGVFLFMAGVSAFGLVVFLVREHRASREDLAPLLGVVSPPEERSHPAWLVPLSPIEDEEEAWELDRQRRKDMENNA